MNPFERSGALILVGVALLSASCRASESTSTSTDDATSRFDPGVAFEGLCTNEDDDLVRPPPFDASLTCEANGDADGAFFTSSVATFPREYTSLHDLCGRMDPVFDTRDDLENVEIGQALREWLKSLLPRAPLQRALRDLPADPEARVDALMKTWFSRNAFEHVFCGDLNPDESVGGLHLWSEYYFAEREGRLNYRCARSGSDKTVASTRFDWRPPSRQNFSHKPIGSMFVGMSPSCYLAVGYVAMKTAPPFQSPSVKFRASPYGVARDWVLARDERGMLSLYPTSESSNGNNR